VNSTDCPSEAGRGTEIAAVRRIGRKGRRMNKLNWNLVLSALAVAFSIGQANFAASSDGFPWSNFSANGTDELSLGSDAGNSIFGFTNQNPYTGTNQTQGYLFQNTAGVMPLFPPNTEIGSTDSAARSGISLGQVAAGGSVTNGGIAQGNIDAAQSGPGAAGLFTPNSPGNAAALKAQTDGALQGGPIVTGSGANVRVMVPVATPSLIPSYKQFIGDNITGTIGATKSAPNAETEPTNAVTTASGPFAPPQWTTPAAAEVRPLSPAIRARMQSLHLAARPPRTATGLLGDVIGSMSIDGETSVYGSNGTLHTDKYHGTTLKLNNGPSIKLRDPHHSVEQLANKNQNQM
jgi:hypothetical protein